MKEEKVKPEEVSEEEKEEVSEEVKEKVKPVMLGQVPTEYGLVYQTPDGVLNEKEYLAWMGNLLVKIKEGTVGA